MKKLVTILLALCMALAAFSAPAEEEMAGDWYAKTMTSGGTTIDVAANGIVIILSLGENSEFYMAMDGDDEPIIGTWAVEGDTLALTAGGNTIYGKIADGTITATEENSGTEIVFTREKVEAVSLTDVKADASAEEFYGTWTPKYVEASGKTITAEAYKQASGDTLPGITVSESSITFTKDGLFGTAMSLTQLIPIYADGAITADSLIASVKLEKAEDGMIKVTLTSAASVNIVIYMAPAEAAGDTPAEEPAEAPAEEPAEAPAEEPAEAPADEPAESAQEGPLAVLSENTFVVEDYADSYSARYLAKVQNVSDAPLYIRDGSLKVNGKDGSLLGESAYIFESGSEYLEPGEISFIKMQADIPWNAEVDVVPALEANTEGYWTDYAMPVTEFSFTLGQDKYDSTKLYGTVTNEKEEPVPEISAVFVLEDAEGRIWDIQKATLYSNALCPGSSVIMTDRADSGVVQYCRDNGIELTTLEVFAWAKVSD